jgi:hypothetical protein
MYTTYSNRIKHTVNRPLNYPTQRGHSILEYVVWIAAAIIIAAICVGLIALIVYGLQHGV